MRLAIRLKFIAYKLITVYYNVKIGLFLLFSVLGFNPAVANVTERKEKPKVLSDGVEDHYAQINGIKIHYVSKGDPAKPLMLFVHGFPEFWYSWRYQLQEFSKDHWCVALDMRGYNESEKPQGVAPYAIDELVADLLGLIKHLGKPPTLVCHDWGSVVGFEFILRHMEEVQNYIMLCAPPMQVHRAVSQDSWDQFRKMWYIFFFQGRFVPELSLRSSDLAIFNNLKCNYVSAEDVEAFKYVFGQELFGFSAPLNYYRANVGKKFCDKYPVFKNYKRGTLLLAENDHYIATATGPPTEKLIPNLKYTLLKNVDHFCQQTNPEVVNQAMRNFLEGQ